MEALLHIKTLQIHKIPKSGLFGAEHSRFYLATSRYPRRTALAAIVAKIHRHTHYLADVMQVNFAFL